MKSQLHLASPPPDAKGDFCLMTVKDASVPGYVALVCSESFCAITLLPPSRGVEAEMLWSDGASLPPLSFQSPWQ